MNLREESLTGENMEKDVTLNEESVAQSAESVTEKTEETSDVVNWAEEATDEMLKVAAIPDSPVLYINLTFDNAIKQTFDKVLKEAERVDLKIVKKSKSEGYIEFENGSSI